MQVQVQNHSSWVRFDHGDVAAILAQQEAAGADVVTDGLAPWIDAFGLVVDHYEGVEPGERRPYFGVGGEVRCPRVVGRLRRRGSLAKAAWEAAQALTRRPVKAVLPGPVTLARCADLGPGPYADFRQLAQDLAAELAQDVAELAAAGARWIQFDEPALLEHPEDIRILRETFELLWAARGEARIVLAAWGPGSAEQYAALNSVPADVLALDLASDPALAPLIEVTGASKELILGLHGSEPVPVASAEEWADRLLPLLRHYEFDTLSLSPSKGLRFATAARAFDTLQRVTAAAECLRSRL